MTSITQQQIQAFIQETLQKSLQQKNNQLKYISSLKAKQKYKIKNNVFNSQHIALIIKTLCYLFEHYNEQQINPQVKVNSLDFFHECLQAQNDAFLEQAQKLASTMGLILQLNVEPFSYKFLFSRNSNSLTRAYAKQYLGKLAFYLKFWGQKFPNSKFLEEYNKIKLQKFPVASLNPQEYLIISPIRAEYLKDMDFFSKMDPYVVITYNNQIKTSTVAENQGKLPSWNNKFCYEYDKAQTMVTVASYDSEGSKGTLIGQGSFIPIYQIGRETTQQIEQTNQNKNQGKVFIKYKFDYEPAEEIISQKETQKNLLLEQQDANTYFSRQRKIEAPQIAFNVGSSQIATGMSVIKQENQFHTNGQLVIIPQTINLTKLIESQKSQFPQQKDEEIPYYLKLCFNQQVQTITISSKTEIQNNYINFTIKPNDQNLITVQLLQPQVNMGMLQSQNSAELLAQGTGTIQTIPTFLFSSKIKLLLASQQLQNQYNQSFKNTDITNKDISLNFNYKISQILEFSDDEYLYGRLLISPLSFTFANKQEISKKSQYQIKFIFKNKENKKQDNKIIFSEFNNQTNKSNQMITWNGQFESKIDTNKTQILRISLIQKNQIQEDIIGSCELPIWEAILGNSEKKFQLIDLTQNIGTLNINFDIFLEEKIILDGVLSILPKQFIFNQYDQTDIQQAQIKVIVNNNTKNGQLTQLSQNLYWNDQLNFNLQSEDLITLNFEIQNQFNFVLGFIIFYKLKKKGKGEIILPQLNHNQQQKIEKVEIYENFNPIGTISFEYFFVSNNSNSYELKQEDFQRFQNLGTQEMMQKLIEENKDLINGNNQIQHQLQKMKQSSRIDPYQSRLQQQVRNQPNNSLISGNSINPKMIQSQQYY